MSISVDTTRFGSIEIDEAAVIQFPTGLIGLDGSRYCLLAREEEAAFVWLQSIDDPTLALPVTNPWRFFEGYDVVLSDSEASRIGISNPADAEVWVTVRATEAVEDCTANLRAPILISRGRGHQVINEADDAPVRAPLFAQIAAGPEAPRATAEQAA
ncbi:MAG: flagellar assembly protein FliW [Thermoleophilaceae bacterium]